MLPVALAGTIPSMAQFWLDYGGRNPCRNSMAVVFTLLQRYVVQGIALTGIDNLSEHDTLDFRACLRYQRLKLRLLE